MISFQRASTIVIRALSLRLRVVAIAGVASLGLLSCSPGQSVSIGASQSRLAATDGDSLHAITHVTVINPAGSANEYGDMTIVIRGNRIISVGPTTSIPIPAGALVHDASGRFVMPGLWDSHVHLSQVGPDAFPLFVANGVTSVRDMGSDFAEIQQWRAARSAGALIPRIIAPGKKLYGGSIFLRMAVRFTKWKHELRVVSSPEDARHAVDELKAQGVDFIKVHNHLTPELYDAIVSESRKVQLTFAGHLPEAGPLAAAAAGQRTIEHGRGMLLCSSDVWARIRSESHADAQYCAPLEIQAALFPALLRAGTWFTPTLTSWRGNFMVGDPALGSWLATLPGSSVVWPALRKHWDDMVEPTPTTFERELIGQFGALSAAASRAGVPLLAGTDLGDSYVIPGFALHDELALMVAAGVTPLAALQSATSEPARAFGLTDTVGAVAPGQAADLLVLDGDPLLDIHNTSRLHAVVLNGRWLAH
jgi:Amidohydrolase family